MSAPVSISAGSAQSQTRQVQLGEICAIKARLADPTQPVYSALPHVSAEDIEPGTGRLLPLQTAEEDGMVSVKYLFEAGDILYSKIRPYLRKVTIAPFHGLCSADMYPISAVTDKVDPAFLKWLLISPQFTEYADRESRRARMPKLNREQLFAFKTTLPPLSEQKRIVAILNEQMAAVEKARAAAEAQLEAARALPAAYLREVFPKGEPGKASLPEGWRWALIEEVCEIQLGKMLSPKSKTGQTSFPYLRNANIGWNSIDTTDLAEMDFNSDEQRKFCLKRGDLLICEGGEPGRAAIWDERVSPCFYQKALLRLRPLSSSIDPQFLMLRMWFGANEKEFVSSNARTTIAHLPAVRLGKLPVSIPPAPRQREISSSVLKRIEDSQALVSLVEQQLEEIDSLPAALLRQAFSGAL